jgi:riboflavin biosynthesis pyrimidine reductase
VLEQLHERGVRTLLIEGGPRVNAGFLGQGLIDEVFWTVGAKLVGNDGLPMISRIPRDSPIGAEPVTGRLVSIHRHDDELFLRYRFG